MDRITGLPLEILYCILRLLPRPSLYTCLYVSHFIMKAAFDCYCTHFVLTRHICQTLHNYLEIHRCGVPYNNRQLILPFTSLATTVEFGRLFQSNQAAALIRMVFHDPALFPNTRRIIFDYNQYQNYLESVFGFSFQDFPIYLTRLQYTSPPRITDTLLADRADGTPCFQYYFPSCQRFQTTIRHVQLDFFRHINMDSIAFVRSLQYFRSLEQLSLHHTTNTTINDLALFYVHYFLLYIANIQTQFAKCSSNKCTTATRHNHQCS